VIALAGLLLAAAALSTPGTCFEPDRMVYVPAGPFFMGSSAEERQRAEALVSPAVRAKRWFDLEGQRQRLAPPAFCVDRQPVTQGEYAKFVAATGHREPGITREEYRRQPGVAHDYDREVTPYLWHDGQPPPGREDHPVVLVTATEANAYCKWRHPEARIPTEIYWERAARGDDGRIFPWGDAWDPARLNSAAGGPGGTTPVGRYPDGRSPYGLFDAVGNVGQWTGTPTADASRIVKGCAWDAEAGLCRPAFRHPRPLRTRDIVIGFRCSAPPAP
jgi:formylglycine-generating enzyme required for sulfatase activity